MSTMEERAALWTGLIAEQRASGLSQAAWCRERNLSFNTFCNWRTRLNKQPSVGDGWVRISADTAPALPSTLQVRIGIVGIDLSPGFDPQLLREVVAALQPTCENPSTVSPPWCN